jgi:hypothetical protein
MKEFAFYLMSVIAMELDLQEIIVNYHHVNLHVNMVTEIVFQLINVFVNQDGQESYVIFLFALIVNMEIVLILKVLDFVTVLKDGLV